ncbi:MAG TPA: MFS transporter [Stellaceae bacterium]|jgi:MFS family permease|nr:MFS transporter [Stellaceae bacterium]
MIRGLSGARLAAVMCIAEILCMAGFATYPALLPMLRATWGMSNAEAGLIGGVLFLGYVAAVPLLTSVTDRIDARRIYLVSAVVAACGSAYFAIFADGFVGALIAQAVFGIGFAGVFMPGLKALSDRIHEELQPRATACYMSLSGFGLAGSYLLAGIIATHASWRLAFAFATVGPLIAGLLVLCLMAPKTPAAAGPRPGFFKSFKMVFANRPAAGYICGYVAHCWEVQGIRAWMVAFLTFAAAQTGGSVGGLEAPTLASIISLGGIFSSIGCNEFAKRFGRINLIVAIMAAGIVFGIATGFSWRISMWVVVILLGGYYATMMADAGALAAGAVAVAGAEMRGATLGVYAMLGYGAGLFAPTAFGAILDLAGGAHSGWAWAAGFCSLALPNAIAITLLRRLGGGAPALAGAVKLAAS